MRRALLSFLIGSLTLVAMTFAGMAFFGMDVGMAMGHDACLGSACDSTPSDASGMACVDHCLSVVPPSSPIASLLLITFFVVLAALFLSGWFLNIKRFDRPIRRWHTDIGKLILHQNLSTIVLRN